MKKNLYGIPVGIFAIKATSAVAMGARLAQHLSACLLKVRGPTIHIVGQTNYDSDVLEMLAAPLAKGVLVELTVGATFLLIAVQRQVVSAEAQVQVVWIGAPLNGKAQ